MPQLSTVTVTTPDPPAPPTPPAAAPAPPPAPPSAGCASPSTRTGGCAAIPGPLAGRTTLIVDATGVGRPVVDAFRAAGFARPGVALVAILITGGDAVPYDRASGYWRVPKRDLVGILAVLLQTRRLKVAAALPHAPTLLTELQNVRVKIDPQTAHDSYSAWREADHDDLVLAVALAVWRGENLPPPPPTVRIL